MTKKASFTADQIVKALRKNKGLIGDTANELKCSRRTIYTYSEKHTSVKEAIADLKEDRLDYTESKLYELIDRGEPAAIFFHLKTQGKSRGWVERQEITGADGEGIGVKFVERIVDQPTSRAAGGPLPASV